MSWDLESFNTSGGKDFKRERILSNILESSKDLKSLIENKKEVLPSFSMMSEIEMESHIKNLAKNILEQEKKELREADVTTNGVVKEIVLQKANETRLVNDLAFLSLNNSEEFLRFAKSTLENSINEDEFSDEFLEQLNKLYFLSDNFTNSFLAFYIANRDKLVYVEKTKMLTENFAGHTNLQSIKQSKLLNVNQGFLIGAPTEGYLVFSVDFQESVELVMNYLFQQGYEDNPFKTRIGDFDYFRDLRNEFTTFANFERMIIEQFQENVLNQTNTVLVGQDGYKVYFIGKYRSIREFKNRFDFKIYGIPFNQRAIIETLGGS